MIDIVRQMRPNPFTHMEDLPVILFEGEQFAHRFRILPMAGVSFDGYQVTARFTRADGQDVAPGGTVTDGAAQVVLTPACYAVPGNFKFFIYVVSESETVCVYACAGNVQATVGRNGQAADPSDPIIEFYHDEDLEALTTRVSALEEIPISKYNSQDAAVTRDLYVPGNINFMDGNTLYQKVPGSLMKTLFNWYVDEHGGSGKTPLSMIDSLTVTGATLTAAFDPSVNAYTGSQSASTGTFNFRLTDVVPHMADANVIYTYSKLSGNASISAGSGSWVISNVTSTARYRFSARCSYLNQTTTYEFTITFTKT